MSPEMQKVGMAIGLFGALAGFILSCLAMFLIDYFALAMKAGKP